MTHFRKPIIYITLVALLSLTFFSCGNDTKEKTQKSDTIIEKAKTGMSFVEKARAISKDIKNLKQLEPITIKELENWLPETIKGLHKTKGGALTQNGITGVNAKYLEEHPEYGKDYGKNLSILIIDGHGEKGASAVGSFVAVKYDNINAEKGNGYTKTLKNDDTIVKEEFNSSNNTYTVSFFYNNRFGVEMKAKGFKEEELWPVFKAFHLETLTN